MSIQIDSVTLDPPVLLAPLAGITDLPFRQLVARFGAGLVVSEMVASQEVVQAKPAPGGRQHQDLQPLLEELARPQEPVQRLVDGPAGGGGQREDL